MLLDGSCKRVPRGFGGSRERVIVDVSPHEKRRGQCVADATVLNATPAGRAAIAQILPKKDVPAQILPS